MKKQLRVLEDFNGIAIKEGDVVHGLKILDMNYQNEYGTFILCAESNTWKSEVGVPVSKDNPYEILGVICIPGYPYKFSPLLFERGRLGFFVKNHRNGEVRGLSNQETKDLIIKYGAKNAKLFKVHWENSNYAIEAIEELPPFTSSYWIMTPYNEHGEPRATFSDDALKSIDYGIKIGALEKIRRNINYEEYEEMESKEELFKEINKINKVIKQSNNIVVLTGPGINTASGVPDLWNNKAHFLAEDLTCANYYKNKETFWKSFYELIRGSLMDLTPYPNHDSLMSTIQAIVPHEGHLLFSTISSKLKKLVTIVTHNTDGLHQRAGSKEVLELQGNLLTFTCISCNSDYKLIHHLHGESVPRCELCGDYLRPDITFPEETIRYYEEAKIAIELADLIVVVGTSLSESPFSELINYKNDSAKLVLVHNTLDNENISYDFVAVGDIDQICYTIATLDSFNDDVLWFDHDCIRIQ